MLANQARGIRDLRKVAAMQAKAGSEESFGASRADALREQIRRSKAASSSSSLVTGSAPKTVDSTGDAAAVANASGSRGASSVPASSADLPSIGAKPRPLRNMLHEPEGGQGSCFVNAAFQALIAPRSMQAVLHRLAGSGHENDDIAATSCIGQMR